MEAKTKRTLSLSLMLILILSIFAGCGETSSGNNEPIPNETHSLNEPIQVDLNKWVLTNEKSVAMWTGNNAITQTEYRYDDQGRLNYQKLASDTEYTYSEFSYDSKGNVISCTETIDSDDYWAENLCSYTYDKNGRLIASQKIDAEGHEEKTIEYDYNGNIIKESYRYYCNGELEEITDFEYNLKYENNLCVMAEINITGEEYYDSTPYAYNDIALEKYYYDSNGNKVKKESYWDDDNGSVVVNGKHYELEKTTTYTWQKLGDIIGETPDNNIYQPNDSKTTVDENNYHGLPAPIYLTQTYTNGKTSVDDHTSYRVDVESLCMIEDEEGYNYLVFSYSVTNLTNRKINMGLGSNDLGVPHIEQNGVELDLYYGLSTECEEAYADILGDGYIPSELRPGETVSNTCVYEVYNTNASVRVYISPITYVTHLKDEVSIIADYCF